MILTENLSKQTPSLHGWCQMLQKINSVSDQYTLQDDLSAYGDQKGTWS